MPAHRTLLAHISPRLSSGEENLATEALCFVLNQSPAARRGFVEFLARVLDRPLPDLSFRTQAGHEDGTIPDLVGVDTAGRPVVYVESKFWAGLTDSQPLGYLQRLQREGGVGLVIIAPANRLVTLWPPLVQRCENSSPGAPAYHGASDHRRLGLGAFPPLVLTTWNAVLKNMLHAASIAGDMSASEDLRQIQGLCESMEEAGFLPLRLEEVTGNVPRRILDYCGLVDDVTSELASAGLVSIGRLKATGGRGYYGKWFRMKGNGARLSLEAGLWARQAPTPLWLRVLGPDFKTSSSVNESLAHLVSADPPKAFPDPDGAGGGILIPLTLATGSERHLVLESLVHQIRSVYDLVPEAPVVTGTGPEARSSLCRNLAELLTPPSALATRFPVNGPAQTRSHSVIASGTQRRASE